MRGTDRQVRIAGFVPFGVAAVALVAAAALVPVPEERERERDGKGRKVPGSVSFFDRTVVEAAPSPSAISAFDSERVWSGFDDWEPAVATDPSTSDVYQMTTRYNGPKPCNGCQLPAMIFRRSSDGGATWGADKFVPVTKSRQYDPQVEVAAGGAVYVVWIDSYDPGVRFTRSTDRGATFSAPLLFTGRRKTPAWSDKPVLAVSNDGRDVYIGFNSSDAWVASSHNFGASFGPNVKTSNDTRYWFHTAGAVADDGTVYFITTDFTQDYTGDANIRLVRSTDAGASWTTLPIDTSRELPGCPWAAGCYFGFFGSIAGLAVDNSGTVAVAYMANNAPGAPQQVWFRKSNDRGATWSARVSLSGQPASVNHHTPAIAAGNTPGDFRAVWQDDRNGSPNNWNAWYRTTSNGGNTWSATQRLSDLGSGAPYKTAAGHRFPYGDYLEIAVDTAGVSHVIWGEGASFTGPGGVWYTRGQ
jgi:hypothetical protein